MGVGSLVGVVVASNLSAPRYQRRILVGGQLLLGLAMIGFALTPIYWLSLAALFVLGAGSSAFNVSIQQNLQMLVPNEFRGRVLGLWSIVHSSVRPLGEIQFSAVAAAASAPVSLILGGVMVLASVVFFSVYRRPMQSVIELRESAAPIPK
jgi:DHA3 family macrolide efflux protein-like MFS transporter